MTRVPGKSYVVGGAIRDRLLGLPVSDRDHVVVGATVDAMTAAGFKPVGRDFPVFLHPETHEEYALARTERKTAAGYAGFVFHADPSVTLADDLARRDLTINAIAEDDENGVLVDPFGGRRDLADRVFRHVGPAFVEDPVRLLRLARFAARFPDFTIAPETLTLARAMVDAGEVDALVPERVWQELSRGLMESAPLRMFDVLRDSRALPRLLPGFATEESTRWREVAAALTRAAAADAPLERRFAIVMHALEDIAAIASWCARFAVPRAARECATLVAREGAALRVAVGEAASTTRAATIVALLERADAFRRRARFVESIAATADLVADAAERRAFERRIRALLDAVDAVDTAAVVAAASRPEQIAVDLRRAREDAVMRAG